MGVRNENPLWGRLIAANTLRRVLRDRREPDGRRERARDAARRLAERIGLQPGVLRVILFGSLAGEGGLVHRRSDIDLAVEGLAAGGSAAIGAILDEFADFRIDLVRLEEAAPELRRRIEREGEVLFVDQ